jgi:hypothetical protein
MTRRSLKIDKFYGSVCGKVLSIKHIDFWEFPFQCFRARFDILKKVGIEVKN